MGTTDDTSKKRPARNTPPATALRRTFQLKRHEAPPPASNKLIESERRRLLHVHGVLHCLYEVLLYADGEDAVLYAEAAHLASVMVDESVAKLDSTRIKPLIDALKMESGGHGGLAAERAATAAVSGKLAPPPCPPPQRRGRVKGMSTKTRNYPLWIAIALVVLYVGAGGAAKLAGVPYVHSSFPKLGLPAWFGYFIGVCEVLGLHRIVHSSASRPRRSRHRHHHDRRDLLSLRLHASLPGGARLRSVDPQRLHLLDRPSGHAEVWRNRGLTRSFTIANGQPHRHRATGHDRARAAARLLA